MTQFHPRILELPVWSPFCTEFQLCLMKFVLCVLLINKYMNSPLHYGPSTGNKYHPIPISAYGPGVKTVETKAILYPGACVKKLEMEMGTNKAPITDAMFSSQTPSSVLCHYSCILVSSVI